MRKLRIGLVGAGGIARHHAPGFTAVEDKAIVSAIAEPNVEAASAVGRLLGRSPRLYADWRELIDKAAVDAVDICLPHDLHAEAASMAAAKGIHVLVEKPIALDLSEADAMIAAARAAGVKLMVMHDRRFEPTFVRIKELLDAGSVGRPLLYRLDNNQYVRVPRDSWMFSSRRLGGGAILSNLVHQFDVARWYEGNVAQVGAMSVTLPDRLEGELIGVVPLRFQSGALADCIINWGVHGRLAGPRSRTWYELVWVSGEEGSLHNLNGLHLMRYSKSTKKFSRIEVPGPPGGHVPAIAHFVDCILHDRKPRVDGNEGRAALEIALAAYESERRRRLVDLPMVPVAESLS